MKRFLLILLASLTATAAYADCYSYQNYSLEDAETLIHTNYQGQMIVVNNGSVDVSGNEECPIGFHLQIRNSNNAEYSQITLVNKLCDLGQNWSGNGGQILCFAK